MITSINEFKQKLNENANVKPTSKEEFIDVLNRFIYGMISSFADNDMVSQAIVNIYEKVVNKPTDFAKNEFDEFELTIPQMDECWKEIKIHLPNISDDTMADIMSEYEYELEDVMLNIDNYKIY